MKPLNQSFLNFIELFNESCLLVSSYFLPLFTDLVPDVHLRYQIGWYFIWLQIFNIGVNFLCIFYKVFGALKMIIKRAYMKWQAKRKAMEATKEVKKKKARGNKLHK